MNRFEDLIAWQRARSLVKACYLLCRKEQVCRDFVFCNQLTGAALSVMSNIAEGFERHSGKEFVRFLTIAIASCAEVRSQLYAAFDLGYCDRKELQELLGLGVEVARVTKALKSSIQITEN